MTVITKTNRFLIFAFVLMIISALSFSQDKFLDSAYLKERQQKAQVLYEKEVKMLSATAQKKLSEADTQRARAWVKQMYINKISKDLNPPEKNASKAYIFISFSMPELSLSQWLIQAARYHIPVLVRGLYKNSFKQTRQKISQLMSHTKEYTENSSKMSLAIDPRPFKQFGITHVPAIIIAQNPSLFDRIYGDIPVKQALEMIAEQGSSGQKKAKQLLSINARENSV